MSYQLTTAKVWDGSAWVEAAGGGKAGQDLVFAYSSDFASPEPMESVTANPSLVSVIADVSAHTFGAWTELANAAPFDCSGLAFVFGNRASAAASGRVLEIGVGAAGAETAVCRVAVGSHSQISGGYMVVVPLGVAAGSRISARFQSVIAGGESQLMTLGLLPKIGDFGSAATVDTYGVDLATSRGVNVSPSSTWTGVASSTTRDYRALIVVWSASNASMANRRYIGEIGIGAAGSESTIAYSKFRSDSGEGIAAYQGLLPFLYVGHVSAGSRLSVRHDQSDTYIDACILGIPYL